MESSSERKRRRSSEDASPQDRRVLAIRTLEEPSASNDSYAGHSYQRSHVQDNARVQFGDQNTTNNINVVVSQRSRRDESPDAAQSLKEKFMKRLRFPGMDSRYESVKRHHAGSCKWLLGSQEWLDWRDKSKTEEHNGFLWIKGKAGSGKSTIMRFALDSSQKEWKDDILVSYFFDARGANKLQRSVEGMYRTLLYQLLGKAPNVEWMLEDMLTRHRRSGELGLDLLKDMFGSVVIGLDGHSLTCFVDALDECEEDEIRDMVGYFEEFAEFAAEHQINLNICFSSRHYRHVTINKAVHLKLEDQAEHQEDITRYIKSKLHIGDSKIAQEIKAEVERRANHIFLWVYLVVPMLNTDADQGNISNLRTRLDEIPDELDDLFRAIIHDGSPDSSALVITLQWILFAKRPLECEELYFGIQSSRGEDAVVTWNRDELTAQDMQRFLLHSSRGLAEITRGKRRTVQFIHESVRHFVSQERGLPDIQKRLCGNLTGLSHDDLKHCCRMYLSALFDANAAIFDRTTLFSNAKQASWSSISERHPLFEYALTSLLYHADAAQKHGAQQHDFLRELDSDKWTKILSHKSSRSLKKPYVFADYSYNSLLEVEIQESSDLNIEDITAPWFTPLGAAVCQDNEHGVHLLLRQGASPMSRADSKLTAFDVAIKKGHTTMYLDMLAHGAPVGVDSRADAKWIYWAAMEGHDDIIRDICDRCRDVNADLLFDLIPRSHYGRALTAASARGHVDTVKVLIDQGADVNCRNEGFSGYETPLLAAAYKRQTAVIETLLVQGARTDHHPLHAAVASKNADAVRLLVAFRADINEHFSFYGTPLHLAVAGYDLAVIQLLLESGADADIQCPRFGAALHIACLQGNVKAAKLLLDEKADPSCYHEFHGTPLHCASHRGYTSIVELLLEHGAEVDQEGSYYGSALCAASAFGHSDVVQKLLQYEADVDLVPELVEHPPGFPDAKSAQWLGYSNNIWTPRPGHIIDGTALHYAVKRNHKEVVELLLAAGANVNAEGYEGFPLYIARYGGFDDIASILLQHGAAYRACGAPTDKLRTISSPVGVEKFKI